MHETRLESYKAAIFRGPGSVEVVDLPYPACGDDDVIVRNLLTGVCGSDIASFKYGGDDNMVWKDHEFGHEGIAEIHELGRNVKDLDLGDRVFVNQGKALRDMNRMATVGGFSEYIRIPQCELGYSVFKIDSDIPLRTAVLFEPFIIGARVAQGLNPGPGKTAIVFGAGIIGLSAAIMLKWYGCGKVMIVDLSSFRLEKAAAYGLLTCNSAKEELKAKAIAEFGLRKSTIGDRCAVDLYVDAIGMKAAIDNFEMLAGQGAAIGVAGVHHGPIQIDMLKLCYANWKILGRGHLLIEEAMVDVLAMMRSGRFDLSPLVTHEYPVDEIVDALKKGADASSTQKVCIAFA